MIYRFNVVSVDGDVFLDGDREPSLDFLSDDIEMMGGTAILEVETITEPDNEPGIPKEPLLVDVDYRLVSVNDPDVHIPLDDDRLSMVILDKIFPQIDYDE